MNNNIFNDLYMNASIQELEKERDLNRRVSAKIQRIKKREIEKLDPLTIDYNIKMGYNIPERFRKKGIFCIEVLNSKFTRIITDKGKVGVSIKHENDSFDYNFGVTMAYTRAIDGDSNLSISITNPITGEISEFEFRKENIEIIGTQGYDSIIRWIGKYPLTKNISDYNLKNKKGELK